MLFKTQTKTFTFKNIQVIMKKKKEWLLSSEIFRKIYVQVIHEYKILIL